MILDLLSAKAREPAECVVRVGSAGEEISELYPFLTELEAETSRSEAAVATMRFASVRDENGTWSVQDAGVFAPWEPFVVEAAFGSRTEEILRGTIREIRADYPSQPGSATVVVSCQDESFALDRTQKRRVWGGDAPTDDGTVVTAILSEHGLAPEPGNATGLSGLVLNQNATDVRFLRERAEANGYELLFREGQVYFGPMRLDAEPQDPILVYAGRDTNCISFSANADGHRADQVAFNTSGEDGAASVEEVVAPDLPLLGTEAADSGSAGFEDFVWRMERQGSNDPAELRARAVGRANEEAMKVGAEGELDGTTYGHVLRVGEPVGVDGVGEWLGGVYYVDSVTHRFSKDGYRQTFRLLRNAYGDNLESSSNPLAAVFP